MLECILVIDPCSVVCKYAVHLDTHESYVENQIERETQDQYRTAEALEMRETVDAFVYIETLATRFVRMTYIDLYPPVFHRLQIDERYIVYSPRKVLYNETLRSMYLQTDDVECTDREIPVVSNHDIEMKWNQ